jgi:hypothetical protein
MRLSMEEVQKQHESTKKLYEQGLTVAPVDVKRVLDLYDTIEALQQENEQLQAQAAQMREACILGYSYLSLIFHRADIKNWNEVGMCSVKDIKHVLNELESAYKGGNTPADYHNPADVEALRKAREAIQRAKENFEPYGEYEYDVRYDLEEALAEIDKAIGGKEDV